MADITVRKSDGRNGWFTRLQDQGDGTHAEAVAAAAAAAVVTPAAQATANDWAPVAGSTIDALCYRSLAYTLRNSHGANGLNWRVIASNDAAFAATVEAQASALVAAGASGAYAVAQAPYRYYRAEVQSAVPGDHATAVVVGLAKG
jgi:hypothetical protein